MLMTAVIAAVLMMQSAPGGVVWEQAAPTTPAAEASPSAPPPDLPDWAKADPFAWERAQCSPLVRGPEDMGACQARVRADLFAVLGDDLPDGLRPTAQLTDCGPQPDGNYALACNAPRREPAIRQAPEQDCRTRPQRRGQGVAWTQDCRPLNSSDQEGLRLKIGGRD